jgi:hypothetical protein
LGAVGKSAGDKRRAPLPRGGALTRSPEGRLRTLQTHGQAFTPAIAQEVWSAARRRRYPRAWDGRPLEAVGYAVEWQPGELACGACGRSLGRYAAYRTRHPVGGVVEEVGLVEDTARRYERQAALAVGVPGGRGPRPRPRFWLEGKACLRAAKTTACFRCPGCGREYRRNLARLGEQLFERPGPTAFPLK